MRWDWFWYAIAALCVVNTPTAFGLVVAGLVAMVGWSVAR